MRVATKAILWFLLFFVIKMNIVFAQSICIAHASRQAIEYQIAIFYEISFFLLDN